MENVSRTVGNCLTETTRKDFIIKINQYAEFVHVSQFRDQQPKHVSEIAGPLATHSRLSPGMIVYGVEQDGTLTWLGQIIDSSD